MAVVAACTDKGASRSVNQDACCIQVAQTGFGEVLMAVVCDGVGGLAAGELASATVVYRFVQWFNEELPTLLAGMDASAPLDLDVVQTVWGIMLTNLNETIQAYGRSRHLTLGTTFTGIFLCDNRYLIGHVGDCRVYCLEPRRMRQITEDQTLLAKKLREGQITPQEAATYNKRHVILQSVGTEGILRPVYYKGTHTSPDIFVMCCDGAYKKAENRGMDTFFDGVDWTSEDELRRACQSVVAYDIAHGEKDNLTVVAVNLGETHALNVSAPAPMKVNDATEEDLPTMTEAEEELPTEMETSDEDIPTMVEDLAEVDMSTTVEDEEDIPTQVEIAEDDLSEEDMPTRLEGSEA